MSKSAKHFETVQRVYRGNPTITNANMYRTAANRCVRSGGTELCPTGFPGNDSLYKVIAETEQQSAEWLAMPDNEADKTVTLQISANTLTCLVNTAFAKLVQYHPDTYDEQPLWYAIEAIRDQISKARR